MLARGSVFRLPSVKCREPKGAFYAFPDVSAYLGKKSPEGHILDDDIKLCDWLVEVGKVAVVPGSGFGAPGFVRLAYACSMQDIEVGVGRMARALAQLLACLAHWDARPAGGGADAGDHREQGVLPEVVGLPPGDLIEHVRLGPAMEGCRGQHCVLELGVPPAAEGALGWSSPGATPS